MHYAHTADEVKERDQIRAMTDEREWKIVSTGETDVYT